MVKKKFKPSTDEKRPFIKQVISAVESVEVGTDLQPELQQSLLKLRTQICTYAEQLMFVNSRKDEHMKPFKSNIINTN